MGGKNYKIKQKKDQLIMTRKEGKKALHCLIMGFAMFFLSMGIALAVGPGPSREPEPVSIAGGATSTASPAAPTPAPLFSELCSRETCDTMPGWATFFFSGVVLLLFGLCVGGTVGGCKEEKLAFSKQDERTATLSTLSFKRVESNVKVHRLRGGEDSPVARVGQRTGGKGKKMLTAYAVYMYTDAPPLSDGTPQEIRVWSGSKQRAVQMQTMINKFFSGKERAGTLHPDTPGGAESRSGLDLEMGSPVTGDASAVPLNAPRKHGQGEIDKKAMHGLWTISANEREGQVDESTDWQAYLKEARVKSLPGQRLQEGAAKRVRIEEVPVKLEKHDAAVVDIAITTAVDAAGRAMEELIEGSNLGPQANTLWSELLESEELLRVLAEECELIPEDDKAHRAEARLAMLQLQQLVLRLSGQLQVMAVEHRLHRDKESEGTPDPGAAERAKSAVKKSRSDQIAALRVKRKRTRAAGAVPGNEAGKDALGRHAPAERKLALLERRSNLRHEGKPGPEPEPEPEPEPKPELKLEPVSKPKLKLEPEPELAILQEAGTPNRADILARRRQKATSVRRARLRANVTAATEATHVLNSARNVETSNELLVEGRKARLLERRKAKAVSKIVAVGELGQTPRTSSSGDMRGGNVTIARDAKSRLNRKRRLLEGRRAEVTRAATAAVEMGSGGRPTPAERKALLLQRRKGRGGSRRANVDVTGGKAEAVPGRLASSTAVVKPVSPPPLHNSKGHTDTDTAGSDIGQLSPENARKLALLERRARVKARATKKKTP